MNTDWMAAVAHNLIILSTLVQNAHEIFHMGLIKRKHKLVCYHAIAFNSLLSLLDLEFMVNLECIIDTCKLFCSCSLQSATHKM